MWRGAVSDEPQCTRRARDVLRRIYFEAEPLLQRHTELQQSEFWPLHSSSQIEASKFSKKLRLPRRSEAAQRVRLASGWAKLCHSWWARCEAPTRARWVQSSTPARSDTATPQHKTSQLSSRNQAERRCQTVRRQGVSYPRVSPASKSCLGGAGREGRDAGWNSQGAGFETRPPFLPFWARFCRYFWLFLAISGYFWVGCVPRWAGLKINYFARHR